MNNSFETPFTPEENMSRQPERHLSIVPPLPELAPHVSLTEIWNERYPNWDPSKTASANRLIIRSHVRRENISERIG